MVRVARLAEGSAELLLLVSLLLKEDICQRVSWRHRIESRQSVLERCREVITKKVVQEDSDGYHTLGFGRFLAWRSKRCVREKSCWCGGSFVIDRCWLLLERHLQECLESTNCGASRERWDREEDRFFTLSPGEGGGACVEKEREEGEGRKKKISSAVLSMKDQCFCCKQKKPRC